MKRIAKFILPALLAAAGVTTASAQSEIYPQHFDLEEVTLLDGPLKTAMDKNITTLLRYDVDRLLSPFVRQAGLNTGQYANWLSQHPIAANWGSGDFHLEGHVGGHYMTALALAYAASHDASTRNTIKVRAQHMLEVLKDCQDAYDNDTEGLYGFIGGQPCNDAWKSCYRGTVGNFGACAVPLYCQHKILAGLRDLYLYMDGEEAATAKTLFRKLCDWHVNLISNMSDNTLQGWLGTEHGGVNETLADAYRIFGDNSYLTAAKRYSHAWEVNGMQSLNTTFLDNQHANTQVPKFIGFARIAQEDATATNYRSAALNFWDDVAGNRTVCIGGNSVNEHFMSAAAGNRYIDETNGPESCNTNNMLKLSEDLFDSYHDSKYADFYESAMYNHILSTQDPETGGYVYFTPLRPQSYRIYSQPDEDMWCCVGTGMENHSKYGHFIYTHQGTTLYVNLFTASQLQSDAYALTQETRFPYEQATKLTIDKAGTFALAIRKPSWTGEGFAIKVNGSNVSTELQKGYAVINRSWAKGDVVTVSLPMSLRYEQCPNQQDYIAFKYGPMLLGARTSAVSEGDETGLAYEALSHEYALGERMGHAPDSYAPKKSLGSMPMLIGERADVLSRIAPLSAEDMTFTIDVSRNDAYASNTYAWNSLTLAPYYTLHHSRVNNYFYQQTADNYANSTWAQDEIANLELDAKSLCSIDIGQQQAEAGAVTHSTNSSTGTWKEESYRDLTQKNEWMQIVLDNNDATARNLSLILRLNADDKGRACDIYVNDEKLTSYTVPGPPQGTNDRNFYNLELSLGDMAYDSNGNARDRFVVRIVSTTNLGPGLYWMRLIKDGKVISAAHYEFNARDFRIGDGGRATGITYNADNSFTISGNSGYNNVCFGMKLTDDIPGKYYVTPDEHWYVVMGRDINIHARDNAYIWWFNGYNNASQTPPDCQTELNGMQILAWDITKHAGSKGNFTVDGGKVVITNNGTGFIDCLGLTSSRSDGKATITLVDYMTDEQVADIFGTEMTDLIQNPSFETGSISPWTLSRNTAWNGINTRNGNADWATDGSRIFGVWDGTSYDVKVSQTVTLPTGRYTLTVDMLASNANRIGRQCVFAGNNRGYFRYATPEDGCIDNNSEVYTGDNVRFQTIKVDFHSDGTTPIELGAATFAGVSDQTWFKIDNFRLYLQGDYNHDRRISITDLTWLINKLFDGNTFVDFNRDGTINTQDVLDEVDMLMKN